MKYLILLALLVGCDNTPDNDAIREKLKLSHGILRCFPPSVYHVDETEVVGAVEHNESKLLFNRQDGMRVQVFSTNGMTCELSRPSKDFQ